MYIFSAEKFINWCTERRIEESSIKWHLEHWVMRCDGLEKSKVEESEPMWGGLNTDWCFDITEYFVRFLSGVINV